MSKRAKRIQDQVSIERVMRDLGYPVRGGGMREEQFPCDLHGDGNDGRYSARMYPESSSWYCFACGKSRDAIETYRDKFGLEFGEACELLEKKYGLEVWKWTPRTETNEPVEPEDTGEEQYEKEKNRIYRLLSIVRTERAMKEVLAWWEGYDCIVWHVSEGKWDFHQGFGGLQKIRKSILGAK